MIRPLIAMLCLATPAFALSELETLAKDSHVRVVVYDPQNRTPLVLQKDMVTNVTFGAEERIKRVMQVEDGPIETVSPDKLKNGDTMLTNLPLFGKVVGSTTLVALTILPDGSERPYLFAVRVIPTPRDGGEDPAATFQLTFTYPTQIKQAQVQKAVATWQEKAKTKAQEIAEARLNTDVFYGSQSYAYRANGKFRNLSPVAGLDNGRLTAFRYPGNMPYPAVFKVNDGQQGQAPICKEGGKPTRESLEAPEQVLSFDRRDDLLVVHQTAAHFRLRADNEVIDVWNCAYDPIGANPGTGTTSPDVYRRVITAK